MSKKVKAKSSKSTAPKNGVKGPAQQSIPGTNIPELEELAEDVHAKTQARLTAHGEEMEAREKLRDAVEKYIKGGKLKQPPTGATQGIYFYVGDDGHGSNKQREIAYGTGLPTVSVRNAKEKPRASA